MLTAAPFAPFSNHGFGSRTFLAETSGRNAFIHDHALVATVDEDARDFSLFLRRTDTRTPSYLNLSIIDPTDSLIKYRMRARFTRSTERPDVFVGDVQVVRGSGRGNGKPGSVYDFVNHRPHERSIYLTHVESSKKTFVALVAG